VIVIAGARWEGSKGWRGGEVSKGDDVVEND
jgi:hypothetical protein